MTIILNTDHFNDHILRTSDEIIPKAQEALHALTHKTCKGHEMTGWFNWPEEKGFALLKEIKEKTSQLDYHYDLIVVIGVGGSYLGTRAIDEALTHEYQLFLSQLGKGNRTPIVYGGYQLSESSLTALLDLMDEKMPLVNVISKSGTTTEPSIAFRVIREYMEKRFGEEDASKRIIATTDKENGALRELADKKTYTSFEVPDDVGGRYSAFTAVGMLPLSLAGHDVDALMEGSDLFYKELQASIENEEVPDVVKYAAYRFAAWQQGKRIDLMAYSEPRLRCFVEWWKQLMAESEGKNGNGMFPSGLAATTDLHSIGQWVQDGWRGVMETFLMVQSAGLREPIQEKHVEISIPDTNEVDDGLSQISSLTLNKMNDAAMQGVKEAHFEGDVPCLGLSLGRLHEKELGYLLSFMMTACGISCELFGVNAFDQPGVEVYKVKMKEQMLS